MADEAAAEAVGRGRGYSIAAGVGAFTLVGNAAELKVALAKRDPVRIADGKMGRAFGRLAFWDGREGTFRWVALLIAGILALSLSFQYKLNLTWHADWKVQRVGGSITLTPRE
jgi:hypothetical protein